MPKHILIIRDLDEAVFVMSATRQHAEKMRGSYSIGAQRRADAVADRAADLAVKLARIEDEQTRAEDPALPVVAS